MSKHDARGPRRARSTRRTGKERQAALHAPIAAALLAPALLSCAGAEAEPTRLEVPSNLSIEILETQQTGRVTGYSLQPGKSAPYLTWLQSDRPPENQPSAEAEEAPASAASWSLMVSSLTEEGWSSPDTVVREVDRPAAFFANWADTPSFVEVRGGLFSPPMRHATWLEKLGDGRYAYGVQVARQKGDGEWQHLGLLHDDTSPTEHGFVSFAAADRRGAPVWAAWLDGRAMEDGGPMSLRALSMSTDGPEHPSQLLDGRVCECCPTDTAMTPKGPIVVYRDRSEEEIRDIWRVYWDGDSWSAPAPVHVDNWRINGCPVNGPAVATDGDQVVVAWFTGADRRRRVMAALSTDGGASFGPPLEVDGERPYGRVDVTAAGGVFWVSWMRDSTDGAAVYLQPLRRTPDPAAASSVSQADTATLQPLAPPRILALTSAARSSGFPKLLAHEQSLLAAWIEADSAGNDRLRTARVRWD